MIRRRGGRRPFVFWDPPINKHHKEDNDMKNMMRMRTEMSNDTPLFTRGRGMEETSDDETFSSLWFEGKRD